MAVSKVWLSVSRYARIPKMADKFWQLQSAEFHENTTNGLFADITSRTESKRTEFLLFCRQCTHNVTPRRVRVTTATVEKQ